jgi:hypothetical protein
MPEFLFVPNIDSSGGLTYNGSAIHQLAMMVKNAAPQE